MSKAPFNIHKQIHIPHSYSMNNFYVKKEKKPLTPKDSNLEKVNGSGKIGTSGVSPVIIYKKTSKGKQNKGKYEIKKQIKNNNYISDGGLKKKIQKFNYGFVPSSNPLQQYQQIKTTKNKNNKKYNIFFEEKINNKDSSQKSKKYNNLREKKLNSETVRESNKRPIFSKNEKMKNCNIKNKNNNDNNEITKNQEESKKSEEIKFDYMKQLYENGIANEIRKLQLEKKLTPKEILNERKKICLIDKGIELENELNDIKEGGNINEKVMSKNYIEENIVIKSKSPSYNNSLFKSQNEFNYNQLSLDNQSISPKSKRTYKPQINQFEFIKKIKKEQQKISSSNIKPNIKKNRKINNNSNSNFFSDSFGQKIKKKNKFNIKENNNLNNNYIKNNNDNPVYVQGVIPETQSTNDNYPYSHKKSHRTTEELKYFLKSKKLKEKENSKTKEIENNKKLFIRFKNLYNLNMKDLMEDQYKRVEPKRKSRMTKSKSNADYKGIRKKKEVNEYYIGNDPSIKNNSTLVDQSEYLLHILESQQLLVNSKLKRIENISDTETNEENEEKNKTNKLNISKKQINKIIGKEKKSSENST